MSEVRASLKVKPGRSLHRFARKCILRALQFGGRLHTPHQGRGDHGSGRIPLKVAPGSPGPSAAGVPPGERPPRQGRRRGRNLQGSAPAFRNPLPEVRVLVGQLESLDGDDLGPADPEGGHQAGRDGSAVQAVPGRGRSGRIGSPPGRPSRENRSRRMSASRSPASAWQDDVLSVQDEVKLHRPSIPGTRSSGGRREG
ncbi:MAG: hypothetical protein MZU97_18880 [Bacillus subtilis]|nr:hypothetical protein [Bacillus subtilis]